MIIDGPVRLTNSQEIVDRRNRVVIPLCWRNDVDHVRRQEEIGRWLVVLINDNLFEDKGLNSFMVEGRKLKEKELEKQKENQNGKEKAQKT